MTIRRKTAAPWKKQKRGFAVLDREKAVKFAARAVNVLRNLSGFATSSAAWRSGLGYALEVLERQLTDILLFSSSERLPEELIADSGVEQVATDLGKARTDAAGAVKVLRKILKDARGDLSVDKHQCDGLDHALDQIEAELNKLLPPPGAPPKARLPFDDSDEDD